MQKFYLFLYKDLNKINKKIIIGNVNKSAVEIYPKFLKLF